MRTQGRASYQICGSRSEGVRDILSDLEKQDLASGAEIGMRTSGRKITQARHGQDWCHCSGKHPQHLKASLVLTQTLRSPVLWERSNYYSRFLWKGGCGLAPKLGEDAGEKVDADPEENEDVGRGCGCQTGCGPEKDDHGEGCGPWA